jgi:Rieske Fe-S protein
MCTSSASSMATVSLRPALPLRGTTAMSLQYNGGTVTTLSKANTGKAAAQNIAINVSNQPLGGFTTNFSGEPVTICRV